MSLISIAEPPLISRLAEPLMLLASTSIATDLVEDTATDLLRASLRLDALSRTMAGDLSKRKFFMLTP